MTEYELIEGKPRIFAISQNSEMLSTVEEYVDNYDYDYVGSASDKSDIFKKVEELSVNLIFLDSEIEGIDLIELTDDLELYNIPVIIIIGDLFNETIDKLLMSNPFGYLIKPLDEDELQRAMAVALRKHEQNLKSVKEAQSKLQEKSTELLIEKSDSSLLLILCISLIIIAVLSRNATWLQWVLLIPTGAMLINSIVSLKKQKKPEPLKEYPFVSIFIPAHNEEFTIEDTIRSVCQIDYHNEEGEPQYELIVVNDGSTDSTGEILSGLKSEFPQLNLCICIENSNNFSSG